MELDAMIAKAQQRLIEAVREARDVVPATEAEDQTLTQALEAVTSVLPCMPDTLASAVDRAMGDANARIFTRAQLREFLAQLLVDTLVQQTYAISRWMRVRRRRASHTEMRDDGARSLDRRSRGKSA